MYANAPISSGDIFVVGHGLWNSACPDPEKYIGKQGKIIRDASCDNPFGKWREDL